MNKSLLNIQPGDRITTPQGMDGICQWVDYDTGDISILLPDSSFKVCPIREVTPHINRVKDINSMTMEELKEEITLLRDSRFISIESIRKKSRKIKTAPGEKGEPLSLKKGKKKTPLPPGDDPRDVKIPERILHGVSPEELEILRKGVKV